MTRCNGQTHVIEFYIKLDLIIRFTSVYTSLSQGVQINIFGYIGGKMSGLFTLLLLKSVMQFWVAVPNLVDGVVGYFNLKDDAQGARRWWYCEDLIKQKDILTIYALLQITYDERILEPALVAALPPRLAVEHLKNLYRQSKYDGQRKYSLYDAIGGLSHHETFTTDLYLCSLVMHSGSEDIRLAGYCAAGESHNSLLLPLAVIDLLRLRPVPVRHTLPYASRQDVILWYIQRAWTSF